MIGTVACYRPELAKTLENVHATYIKIFEMTTDNTKQLLKKKDFECEEVKKGHVCAIKNELGMRENLAAKLQRKHNQILAMKTQLRVANTTESSLQNEIDQLREILKCDTSALETIKNEFLCPEKGKRHQIGPKYMEHIKQVSEDTSLEQHLRELQQELGLMEQEHFRKGEIMEGMSSVISKMTNRKSRNDKESQVVEEELYWFIDPRAVVPLPTDPESYYALTKNLENTPEITRARDSDESK